MSRFVSTRRQCHPLAFNLGLSNKDNLKHVLKVNEPIKIEFHIESSVA